MFNLTNFRLNLFCFVWLLILLAGYSFFNPSFNSSLLGMRHFEFDLPLWEFEKTCQQSNPLNRKECAACKVKVGASGFVSETEFYKFTHILVCTMFEHLFQEYSNTGFRNN